MRTLRARRSLVVAETSLALVLLICAGLVLQSLQRMLACRSRDFARSRGDHASDALPGPRYNDTTQVQFFRDLQSRLEGRGGIEAVAAANTPPISAVESVTNIRLDRHAAPAPAKSSWVPRPRSRPDISARLACQSLEGRDIAWSDARPMLVVSQAAARQYWPGQIGDRKAYRIR